MMIKFEYKVFCIMYSSTIQHVIYYATVVLFYGITRIDVGSDVLWQKATKC